VTGCSRIGTPKSRRNAGWMETHDLISNQTVTLGVAYDDPDITAPDRCRYDACVVVPADFTPDRWVNVMDVPGGKFTVSGVAGSAHEIRGAWEALYRLWLPGNGTSRTTGRASSCIETGCPSRASRIPSGASCVCRYGRSDPRDDQVAPGVGGGGPLTKRVAV
jgi:GyrI-like small molecule binding domain